MVEKKEAVWVELKGKWMESHKELDSVAKMDPHLVAPKVCELVAAKAFF